MFLPTSRQVFVLPSDDVSLPQKFNPFVELAKKQF